MELKRLTYITVLLIGIVFILIIGKTIIIPIILAGLIWFLVKEIRKFAQRIPFLGKRLPKWLLNLLSVGLLYVILGFTIQLLTANIKALSSNLETYENNIANFNTQILQSTGINIQEFLASDSEDFNFTEVLRSFFASLSELFGNAFMIGLYLLFLLLEEAMFSKKFLSLYKTEKRKKEVSLMTKKISDSISSYLFLKTLVSFITAALSYIALASIQIDSPLFWAFLIFILNFIPTIGSLIATLFPASMALLQFGDLNTALLVLVLVGAIQVIIGNIIEPKIMGNSLNVSSFVVILALSIWGAIWGITGMVLSVPITVILIILFGQFESTKNIAILLSEKGRLND